MNSTTEALARFVATAEYDDLSPELITLMKRQIADTLGVAIAGTTTEAATLARDVVISSGSGGTATIWGTELTASASGAAFANGVASHALDFDDTWVLGTHPSAPTVPAMIAVAEQSEATGREFLVAQAVAYEVHARLCAVLPVRGGWHPTGVLGTFGAVAGACRLLGLDVGKVRSAFGIAGSSASGIDRHEGTMTKPFHAGAAARSGVEAAQLAARGFTANTDVFDGPRNFFEVFYPGVPIAEWQLTAGLGTKFLTEQVGIGVKMYPAGFYLHQAYEAALSIVVEHDLRPSDIAHVEVGLRPDSRFNRPRVTSGLDSKFSIPYVITMAILYRDLRIESFDHETVVAPEVQDFLARVKVRLQPELSNSTDLRHNPVTIVTNSGQRRHATCPVPKSHWRYPLPREEWETKLRANVSRVGGVDATAILAQVDHLEHADTMGLLGQSLRPARSR